MSGTPEAGNLEHDVEITKSPLETPLSTLRLNAMWSKMKTRL